MNKRERMLLFQTLLQILFYQADSQLFTPQTFPSRIHYPQEAAEKDFSYVFDDEEPGTFMRQTKSNNQPRMLNIDLSRLRKDMSLAPTKHKLPMNLMGVDISVLSHNPDPTLPLASKLQKDKINGKYIMGYNFDRFDRLPVIKSQQIHRYAPSLPKKQVQPPNSFLPMMSVPLSAMTSYRSLMDANKQDTRNVIDRETELEHTADFILHMLNQLSSNSRKSIRK